MSKPIVLVDGSSYLYRAFHALPPLTNSQGQPTGAIYGVVNMLRKLLKDIGPEHIAVVFDAKGKTFRDDIFPEYKAHRPPMPDDLRLQIEPVHRIVRAMGLPLLLIDGVEADDVIATLAKQAEAQGHFVLISTGDKDMAQLVTDKITLVNTMTNSVLNPETVFEKFGVRPDQIIDYLSLMGDSVDNVPGVPKVGPKTAAKWLSEYDSLDNLIAHAHDIKGKIGENFRAALQDLPLSKQLVTLKCDVELPITVDELKIIPQNFSTLREDYQTMGFKSWLRELEGPEIVAAKNQAPSEGYACILNEAQLKNWADKIKTSAQVCVDTETTSLNAREARLVGISLAIDNEACYIPMGHDYEGAPEQLAQELVFKYLKPIFENENITKIGQNLKYDSMIFWNVGVNLQGIRFDTMLESYMNNSVAHRHNLDALALEYCGHTMIPYESVTNKGKMTFNQVNIADATRYAAEDADFTLRVHQALWPLLEQKSAPAHLFAELEIPLLSVLAKIEYTGVLIDSALLLEQSQALADRLLVLENKIYELSGAPFNIDSPKQLQTILYETLQLPILSKTPTGQPSTAEPVLAELALSHELPALILEYRSLSKLKSTYTDKLPLQVKQESGRVHTSYHQAVTATGRLSSSDPNLQNIPVRSEIGRAIRKAFIAPEGYLIAAIDYSQIELRIMAHLSNDKTLQEAFHQGLDVHTATASEVFDIPLNEVTSEQRRRAKAINFGLIYGMSAFGLAKQIGASREEAQQYIDIYFNRYPGVKAYMDNSRKSAAELGYVETLRGRRLYLPEIKSSNHMQRTAAERAAINAPLQGTAADIIKQAMLDVDTWLAENNIDARMIMQVHDELVFEVRADQAQDIVKSLVEVMNAACLLMVPLVATSGIGLNWDEAH